MTLREAAKYLRISYMTAHKLAKAGKLNVAKVGGQYRTKKEWLA